MNEVIRSSIHLFSVTIPQLAFWYLVFAFLERRIPAAAHKSVAGWVFNLKVSVLHLLAPVLASGFSATLVAAVREVVGDGLFDLRIKIEPGIIHDLSVNLLFLLIFDFFYYWWHRLEHTAGWLWAVHKLHHMDENLSVSTDARHHWLELIGRIPVITVPMALLFNLTPIQGGLIAFIFSAWTVFIHANLRLHLGAVTRIVCGPQIHRIHHSKLCQHRDCNFAAFFPMYDIVFGTYYHPQLDEFPPSGVAEEPDIHSLSDAALLPFRHRERATEAERS